jgi:hypothetical protein
MTNNIINILGVPYAVRRVPYIKRDEHRLAEINYEAQEIKVLDTLQEDTLKIALLHETVHGILCSLRFLDENDDEKLVQGLAIGLYQALKDGAILGGD